MRRSGRCVRVAALAFVSAATLLFLGCGDSGGQSAPKGKTPAAEATTPVTTAPVPPSSATAPVTTALVNPCPGNIPWNAAPLHIGQTLTVEGPVVGTYYAPGSRGSPTFLDVGAPNPKPGPFHGGHLD